MSEASFVFAGLRLVAGLSGALVLPEARTVVVADLHLEKGSSHARSGALLPPYDSRATLAALTRALHRYQPRTVVCLGDSFHDGQGVHRLDGRDRTDLEALMAGREWVWVVGNHDPAPDAELGGTVVREVVHAGVTFRHEALRDPQANEVSGHFHPKVSVATGARRISAPCFVGDEHRLILPSFGAFTGGLDVFDPAIAGLLSPDFSVWALGRTRVHALPRIGLRRSS